jgi:vacuolar-type H+-ATPase subunit I/STV1
MRGDFAAMLIGVGLQEQARLLMVYRTEPPPTCPLIDKLIDDLQIFGKSFLAVDENKPCDVLDLYNNEWNPGSYVSQLEAIREANANIREWGHEWKRESSDHEDKIGELEDERKRLLNKLDELKDELKEANEKIEALEAKIEDQEADFKDRLRHATGND